MAWQPPPLLCHEGASGGVDVRDVRGAPGGVRGSGAARAEAAACAPAAAAAAAPAAAAAAALVPRTRREDALRLRLRALREGLTVLGLDQACVGSEENQPPGQYEWNAAAGCCLEWKAKDNRALVAQQQQQQQQQQHAARAIGSVSVSRRRHVTARARTADDEARAWAAQARVGEPARGEARRRADQARARLPWDTAGNALAVGAPEAAVAADADADGAGDDHSGDGDDDDRCAVPLLFPSAIRDGRGEPSHAHVICAARLGPTRAGQAAAATTAAAGAAAPRPWCAVECPVRPWAVARRPLQLELCADGERPNHVLLLRTATAVEVHTRGEGRAMPGKRVAYAAQPAQNAANGIGGTGGDFRLAHAAWNSALGGEVALLSDRGALELHDVAKGTRTARLPPPVVIDGAEQAVARGERWQGVWGAHPRVLWCAGGKGLYAADARAKSAPVLLHASAVRFIAVAGPTPGVVAAPDGWWDWRSDVGWGDFAVGAATTDEVLLFDARAATDPLLRWRPPLLGSSHHELLPDPPALMQVGRGLRWGTSGGDAGGGDEGSALLCAALSCNAWALPFGGAHGAAMSAGCERAAAHGPPAMLPSGAARPVDWALDGNDGGNLLDGFAVCAVPMNAGDGRGDVSVSLTLTRGGSVHASAVQRVGADGEEVEVGLPAGGGVLRHPLGPPQDAPAAAAAETERTRLVAREVALRAGVAGSAERVALRRAAPRLEAAAVSAEGVLEEEVTIAEIAEAELEMAESEQERAQWSESLATARQTVAQAKQALDVARRRADETHAQLAAAPATARPSAMSSFSVDQRSRSVRLSALKAVLLSGELAKPAALAATAPSAAAQSRQGLQQLQGRVLQAALAVRGIAPHLGHEGLSAALDGGEAVIAGGSSLAQHLVSQVAPCAQCIAARAVKAEADAANRAKICRLERRHTAAGDQMAACGGTDGKADAIDDGEAKCGNALVDLSLPALPELLLAPDARGHRVARELWSVGMDAADLSLLEVPVTVAEVAAAGEAARGEGALSAVRLAARALDDRRLQDTRKRLVGGARAGQLAEASRRFASDRSGAGGASGACAPAPPHVAPCGAARAASARDRLSELGVAVDDADRAADADAGAGAGAGADMDVDVGAGAGAGDGACVASTNLRGLMAVRDSGRVSVVELEVRPVEAASAEAAAKARGVLTLVGPRALHLASGGVGAQEAEAEALAALDREMREWVDAREERRAHNALAAPQPASQHACRGATQSQPAGGIASSCGASQPSQRSRPRTGPSQAARAAMPPAQKKRSLPAASQTPVPQADRRKAGKKKKRKQAASASLFRMGFG